MAHRLFPILRRKRPCNAATPEGTPLMHLDGFVRGLGRFMIAPYVPTEEKTGPRFPLLLTTGRILSQYNVGAQTRRTENAQWHEEDRLEVHPHDAGSVWREGRRMGGVCAAGGGGGRGGARR